MWLWLFQASLHLVHQPGITEYAVYTRLQASPENPPHGAGGAPCCLVWQTGNHRLKPFQCCPGNRPPRPSLPPREPWLLGTTRSVLPAGFLHPGEPRSPLCWVSCPQHQLCRCISPFAEPRAGKVHAQSLEGSSRSCRNCRHISSLLAGAASVAADRG